MRSHSKKILCKSWKKKRWPCVKTKLLKKFSAIFLLKLLTQTAKISNNWLSEQKYKLYLTEHLLLGFIYAHTGRLNYVVIETNYCTIFTKFVHWDWIRTIVIFQKSQIKKAKLGIECKNFLQKNPSWKVIYQEALQTSYWGH